MAQINHNIDCSTEGADLVAHTNSVFEALNSMHSGGAAPANNDVDYKLWLDTSDASSPVLKIRVGEEWVVLMTYDDGFVVANTNTALSADTAAVAVAANNADAAVSATRAAVTANDDRLASAVNVDTAAVSSSADLTVGTLTFDGAISAGFDGSEDVNVDIPNIITEGESRVFVYTTLPEVVYAGRFAYIEGVGYYYGDPRDDDPNLNPIWVRI